MLGQKQWGYKRQKKNDFQPKIKFKPKILLTDKLIRSFWSHKFV